MLPPSVVSALTLTPVAYFTIDGLAVCSFNQKELAWEVAFIRNDHTFGIEAYHEELTGRIKEKQSYGASALNAPLLLKVDNGSDEHYSKYPGGFFFRGAEFSRADEESRDFRWVIDFVGPEVPNGKFKRLIKKDVPGRPPVTVARLPNSLFYADNVSNDAVILAPENTGPDAGTVLGRSNEEIGAMILADPPGTLRISGADEPIKLRYEPDHVWRISLKNMDTAKLQAREASIQEDAIYVQGDFDRYYQIIEVESTQHYQLWAPRRADLSGDIVILARAGDCHPLTATVGSLMPLIEA